MNSLPDVRGTRPGVDRLQEASALESLHEAPAVRHVPPVTAPQRAQRGARDAWAAVQRAWARVSALDIRWQYPLAMFGLTRVLYLVIALIDQVARTDAHGRHWGLGSEVANWDGHWYLSLTIHGYPHVVSHTVQTTLGFLPLYPMLIYGTGHVFHIPYWVSGLLISTVTGAVATVLICRLATRWWGEDAAKRGILFFCLFPGSIVFSMVYTEGLLLMLIAGCLLALEDRRWVLAGLLAGLSTAVGPVAIAIIPACAVAAFMELRRRGWTDRAAWRSLAAPVLAPLGAIGFAIFLWAWTGTPFASYQTQRDDWHETSTPFALVRMVVTLVKQAIGVEGPPHENVDLNLLIGVLGTIFLVWGLIHLWRARHRVSLPALVWTGVIVLMTVTSNATPPNARMLLCAFPVLLVVAADLRGRAYRRLLAGSTFLLVAMSVVTFVSLGLRP